MKYDEFYKLCEKVYEPITNFEKSCLPLFAAAVSYTHLFLEIIKKRHIISNFYYYSIVDK